MTPKELIGSILEKDMYEIYIWANWFFRPGRVSCVDCIRTRALMSKKVPNCAKCGLPSARLIKRTFKPLVEEAEELNDLTNMLEEEDDE